MYAKNLNHKMTLRLDDELHDFVVLCSNTYRISPSDYIRQCLGCVKASYDRAIEVQDRYFSDQYLEVENGTDRKTHIDNKL